MSAEHPPLHRLADPSPPPDARIAPERAQRLVLLGLVVLNLLVATVCAALLAGARRAEVANARSETLHDVRLTEQLVSGLFDKAAIALSAVSSQVERQLDGGGLDRSTLWQLVDAQTAQVPEIERIGLFDAQGAQLCGLPAERCRHLDVSDRDYFQHLRRHPESPTRLYGPHDSGSGDRPALMLARALRLQDGRFAGVAKAALPLDRLRHLVDAPGMTPGGAVTLRTEDLVVILRQPEFTGPDAADAARRVSDTLRAAVAAAPSEGVVRAVTASDGVERVTAYRRLGRHPLYVLVGRSTDDFLAGWRRQVAWTTGFLLLFAGISGLLARATAASLHRHAQALRLYDSAPCGYHTLDAEGRYLTINATELGWLGCRRDEVVGRLKPTDFTTAEGSAAFAAHFPELVRTGRIEGLDFDLVSRDGTVRRVLVTATAVRDARGRFLHSNSVVHDISDLHEARTRLQAMAAQQGLMLDNDLIGMVKLVDRRIVWKNQAMDRIFGYAADEWIDMPSRRLYFDDATHQRIGAELMAALQQGQAYRCQVTMRHQDGHAVWIDASGALLSDGSGQALVMLADITPLKAAEQARLRSAELEAQNFQLRETNRLKGELVANMSHELRTPLNAILGFGQMLEAGTVRPDSPRFAQYLGRIVASGRHLLGLIDQVLDHAKAESGKMGFDPAPVDVAEALREVVEMLRADREARQVDVHAAGGEGVGTVVTDPVRLRQMLAALVGNAIKFSHEGGRVDVRASAVDDAWWQVEVTDHGIGIDEVDLPRLFAPFVQLSTGSTKTHGGTGMGLALVRGIAAAQGGSVEVRSRPGLGSTFTLTLPRVLAPAPDLARDRNQT